METIYRYTTSWGDGWLRYDDAADAVIAMEVPGAAMPMAAQSIDASAPTTVRTLAKRLGDYVQGQPIDQLVTRTQLAHWLEAAGVDGFRLEASLALFDIPYGATVSYGELAELAGHPRAARAAGSTCARNPLPLVVPCHRVLPASGRLGRYGTQGPKYKQRLLKLEGVSL